MKPDDIEHVLEQLEQKKLGAAAAVAQLVAGGLAADLARETVFTAIGGSGIVKDDRYLPSGRLVSEVEAEMLK